MKIFITGATGYIGLNVARAFRRAGYEVWGLCRSAEKGRMLARAEIHPVLGEMGDPSSYRDIAGKCAVLIHCAADYGEYAGLDKQTTRELLEAACCGDQHKTVIYTSGVWIYGNTGGKSQDETDKVNPIDMVAWRGKIEQSVLQTSGIRSIVMRPGMVYGRQGGLTGQWFQGAQEGTLRIAGEGANHWAMVHVDDLADAYVRAAESSLTGETFNIVDRSRETVNDMVQAVAGITGYTAAIDRIPLADALVQMGPVAEGLSLDQHVDARKAARLLGWQPRHGGFIEDVDIYYESWKAYR